MRDPAAPPQGSGARVNLAADGGVAVRGRAQDHLNEVARVARALWRLTHVTVPATPRPDGPPASIGFSADLTVDTAGLVDL